MGMSASQHRQSAQPGKAPLRHARIGKQKQHMPMKAVQKTPRVQYIGLGKFRPIGITRIGSPTGKPVLFLSGIGGHSGLFFGAKQPGLAGFLAEAGYCCYLIDVADKGLCRYLKSGNDEWIDPAKNEHLLSKNILGKQLQRKIDTGLHAVITQDLPHVLNWVQEHHPDTGQFWAGHGIGGLIWWAFWARYPEYRPRCGGMLQLASARVRHLAPRKTSPAGNEISMGTRLRWAVSQSGIYHRCVGEPGQVALRKLGVAPCDESVATMQQWLGWCQGDQWIDPVDGFCYQDTIKSARRQPMCSYWVAQYGKHVTEADVRVLMGDLRLQNPRLFVIRRPFDNVSLLTSPMAVDNHFPTILSWLRSVSRYYDTAPVIPRSRVLANNLVPSIRASGT